jgi:hypothetical protein
MQVETAARKYSYVLARDRLNLSDAHFFAAQDYAGLICPEKSEQLLDYA